jgi:hypothetical protein
MDKPKGGDVPDEIKVVPELRSDPQLRKLARALIALARRQLADELAPPDDQEERGSVVQGDAA